MKTNAVEVELSPLAFDPLSNKSLNSDYDVIEHRARRGKFVLEFSDSIPNERIQSYVLNLHPNHNMESFVIKYNWLDRLLKRRRVILILNFSMSERLVSTDAEKLFISKSVLLNSSARRMLSSKWYSQIPARPKSTPRRFYKNKVTIGKSEPPIVINPRGKRTVEYCTNCNPIGGEIQSVGKSNINKTVTVNDGQPSPFPDGWKDRDGIKPTDDEILAVQRQLENTPNDPEALLVTGSDTGGEK